MRRLQQLFFPPFSRLRWLIFVVLLAGLAYAPSSLIQTFRFSTPGDYWIAARLAAHASPSDMPLTQRLFDDQGAMSQNLILDVLPNLFVVPLVKLTSGAHAVMLSVILLSVIFLAFLFDILPFLGVGVLPGRRRAFTAFFVLFMPSLVQGLATGVLSGVPYALLASAFFLVCASRASLRGHNRLLWILGALVSLVAYGVFLRPVLLFDASPAWSDAFFFKQLFLPLMGLGGACGAALHTRDRRRSHWVAISVLLFAALGASSRSVFAVAQSQMLALVPLTWLFFSLWDQWAKRDEGAVKYIGEAVLVLIFGFLPVGIVPAAMTGKPLVPDAVFAGASRALPSCDVRDVAPVLHPGWTQRQGLSVILAPPSAGPEILYRTLDQKPVVTPFDSQGIADSKAFFGAKSDVVARDIVKRRQVDYVLVCKKGPPAKAGAMLAALRQNKPPVWLARVWTPFEGDNLLFEVKKDKL